MSEKQNTSKTKKPTAELDQQRMLEILGDAVNKCQQAGLQVQVGTLFDNGTKLVAIVLAGVVLTDEHRLVLQ